MNIYYIKFVNLTKTHSQQNHLQNHQTYERT